jgi:guanylate kinase
LPLNLIIEVDGGYHKNKEQQILDIEREDILKRTGYTILRYTNEEVIQDTQRVINMINSKIQEIQNKPDGGAPLLGRGRGRLLIFSAPSGSGKSTIINWLMEEHPELNMKFSISCTSRPPRGKEQNGVEYFFITPEEFRKKIADDEFVEYEEVYTDRYYGTLKSQVEKQLENGENVVFDVDVHGAMNIKKAYGSQALSLFIQPPSIEELRKRLTGRATEAQEEIEKRIGRAEYELTFADKFDTIIINDDLNKAKEETLKIIQDFLK